MGKRMLAASLLAGFFAGGCATVSSASGAGGAEVVSGDTQSLSALSGAAGDNIATSGSDTTGQAVASDAKPNQPILPGENNTVAPR
jgi:hypothetical protein